MSGENAYQFCSLLLPMDGANNGTTFTDWGINGYTITALGNLKTVTAQSKYYGSSGSFDGTGDYIQTTEAMTNTQDFTLEAWVRPSYVNSYSVLFGYYPGSTLDGRWYFGFNANNKMVCWCAPTTHGGATAVTANTWNHVAYVCEGTEMRFYLNGVIDGSFIRPTFLLTAEARVGKYNLANDNESFSGYVNDLRYTKGAALYTSNFTPPGKLIGTINNNGSGVPAILDSTGSAAVRTVLAVPRDYPSKTRSTTSNSSGRYSLSLPAVYHDVLILDDSAGTTFNDKFVGRVLPA